MAWEARDCPRCGRCPVRWDPTREVPFELQERMEEPLSFRCDGCGETWVSDVADDDSDKPEKNTAEEGV